MGPMVTSPGGLNITELKALLDKYDDEHPAAPHVTQGKRKSIEELPAQPSVAPAVPPPKRQKLGTPSEAPAPIDSPPPDAPVRVIKPPPAKTRKPRAPATKKVKSSPMIVDSDDTGGEILNEPGCTACVAAHLACYTQPPANACTSCKHRKKSCTLAVRGKASPSEGPPPTRAATTKQPQAPPVAATSEAKPVSRRKGVPARSAAAGKNYAEPDDAPDERPRGRQSSRARSKSRARSVAPEPIAPPAETAAVQRSEGEGEPDDLGMDIEILDGEMAGNGKSQFGILRVTDVCRHWW